MDAQWMDQSELLLLLNQYSSYDCVICITVRHTGLR